MIDKYLHKSSNMEAVYTDDITKYQKVCRFLLRILYPQKYYSELFKIDLLNDQIVWYKSQIDNLLRIIHKDSKEDMINYIKKAKDENN
jgi:hypothetical protein